LLAPVPCLGIEAVGPVTDVKVLGNGAELRSGAIAVRISALSPSIVRIRYSRNGAFPEKKSFAVVEDTGLQTPSMHVTDNKSDLIVDTGLFNARIEKSSTRVIFQEHSGEVILQDHPGYPVAWNGTEFRIWKSMPAEEHYFGLGDKPGMLDRRNHAYTNWNSDTPGFGADTDPIYKTIPFFIGMNGPAAYGVFLDNTYWSSFDFGKEKRDAISFGAEDGELDYYFFYGPDPKAVVSEYAQLTGRTPLPPLFMLGYQQCRWTYAPESRAREVAHQFRSRKIPADVIWFDIGYQQDNEVFTIGRKDFPNFEGMVHDLGEQGFKVITIADLHIKKLAGYKPYDEGLAGDHFVKNPDGTPYVGDVWPGPSVFPDFTRPATRKWWGTLFTDFVNM
jgi:alpha-glucosidase